MAHCGKDESRYLPRELGQRGQEVLSRIGQQCECREIIGEPALSTYRDEMRLGNYAQASRRRECRLRCGDGARQARAQGAFDARLPKKRSSRSAERPGTALTISEDADVLVFDSPVAARLRRPTGHPRAFRSTGNRTGRPISQGVFRLPLAVQRREFQTSGDGLCAQSRAAVFIRVHINWIFWCPRRPQHG